MTDSLIANVVQVPLTRGQVAIVDATDWPLVAGITWRLQTGRRTNYATSTAPGPAKSAIRMHRLILNAPDGLDVDHINGDGLDNRRQNLRLASESQNAANRHGQANNKSGYIGVYFNKARRRWVAKVVRNYQRFHLGGFSSPEAAARAYDAKAIELFGEFARLNFPLQEAA